MKFVFACAWLFVLVHFSRGKVFVLTDDNFDRVVSESREGIMVDIYAPWCSHCRDLEPVWERVSKALEGQVLVAKVDATENDALRQRFFVEGYPMIVHLREGQARIYGGARSEEQLVHFALDGWTQTEAVPFYLAPNSWFGRAVGIILGLPGRVGRLYHYMHTTLHISELCIVLIFLLFPILLGVASICLLDYWHTRSSRNAARQQRQHQQ